MAPDEPFNPYVGPRPFQPEDAPRFFGRSREIRDVVSLVVAQRVVLLYSASGAGKSSLLNAGVVPRLRETKSFDILPTARVRSDVTPDAQNVFVSALVASLERPGTSLGDALADLPAPPGTNLRALVVDQFEELFTAHPERWQDQPGLFDELRTGLEAHPSVRLILAIREDFLAQLDPFAPTLPGGLRTRFRLEQLDRQNALAAARRPLEGTARSFAPGVAEALVDDLLRFRVDSGTGVTTQVDGKFVEPVQLQVACRTLWTDLPDAARVITSAHLRAHANVDQVLGRFYDDAVRAAAREGRAREHRVRDWVERTMITPGGTRAAAYAGTSSTAGLSNRVVRVLEEKRLIRAEWRAGARWYELTHDRLIEPIRRANRDYSRVRRRRVVLVAAALIGLAGGATGLLIGVNRTGPSSASLETSADISTLQAVPVTDRRLRVRFELRLVGLSGTVIAVVDAVDRRTLRRVARRRLPVRTHPSLHQTTLEIPKRARPHIYVAKVQVRNSAGPLLSTATSLPVRVPPLPVPTATPTPTETPSG
jgi:hypothetical protein